MKNEIFSKAILTNMLSLIKTNSLLEMLRLKSVSQAMMKSATEIDTATSNGPLHLLAGTLLIQTQSILGFNIHAQRI